MGRLDYAMISPRIVKDLMMRLTVVIIVVAQSRVLCAAILWDVTDLCVTSVVTTVGWMV